MTLSNADYIKPMYRRDNAFIRSLDRKLVALLEQDGTSTLGQAARRLRAPRTAVWIAAQQLERNGSLTITKLEKASGKPYYVLSVAEKSEAGDV